MDHQTFKCWLLGKAEYLLIFTILLAGWALADMEMEGTYVGFFFELIFLSLIPAIAITRFAWNNFQEVIPMNYLWRKSNVDRFGMRLQYSFIVFIEMWAIWTYLPLSLIVLIFPNWF